MEKTLSAALEDDTEECGEKNMLICVKNLGKCKWVNCIWQWEWKMEWELCIQITTLFVVCSKVLLTHPLMSQPQNHTKSKCQSIMHEIQRLSQWSHTKRGYVRKSSQYVWVEWGRWHNIMFTCNMYIPLDVNKIYTFKNKHTQLPAPFSSHPWLHSTLFHTLTVKLVGNILEVGWRSTTKEMTTVGDAGPTGTDRKDGGVVNCQSPKVGFMDFSAVTSWKRTKILTSIRETSNEQFHLKRSKMYTHRQQGCNHRTPDKSPPG